MSAISTASPEETAKFAAMADSWWDPEGKFKPLHKFNPLRIGYVRDRLAEHFGRTDRLEGETPFEGLRLLDVGCGGGLIAEPMARLGFDVTAIDAGEKNVKIAALHAEQSGVKVDYRHCLPEDLAEEGKTYDVVLILEVVEHVADLAHFLQSVGRMVRPGGALIAATLNRTAKSLVMAKFGAEYVVRWLPRGTHDWRKFVKPSELTDHMRHAGLTPGEVKGMTYHPFADSWEMTGDLSMNYIMFATKP
ncbi:bifunctional 2-polyprenyl-6-hydroxyphenol methylase/3-demethylubiquinol 3-O-methyltransferase UbiG [Roseospirillum parvum]|uniref:Ubiquinone biosynthesis O-methyltransferase n=1 Tax=Roseospirillum parvum TaxID=83401 RepID=A0A1G7UWK2_9PROT|nr:bifunctional 2-polyprenyl-6-hydroxyphenol methylase/3-demethylubiquinol 3-O-methyltransferase UbiG [Roseospirillum parvum]SDG51519.1 2-polyprenyl-6-hydroxyphenyl methylase / 3-demethylubiquinone-9 3-methyltransferase [Roseospirillum parvum]